MVSKLSGNDYEDGYTLPESLRQAEHGTMCLRRRIQRNWPKVRATPLEICHSGWMVRDLASGQ